MIITVGMYSLTNDSLAVAILDPIADQSRFGTRYCTGGYIFQITDHKVGELLSGPTFPDSFNGFDGQGIPDAFNLSPLSANGQDSSALIIGIGPCDTQTNEVKAFCTWQVTQQPGTIRMQTTQSHANWSLELTRTVTLERRTVRSLTAIHNAGREVIPVRWFPHPFFPQPETDELFKLNIPVSFPENDAYELLPNGFIARKNWPWTEGHYQPLDHVAHTNLIVIQKHPKLGLVAATCSYAPAFFPIWGNRNTFSWEPFLECTIARGQTSEWWIDYDF